VLTGLVARLAATTDDTQTVRVLAAADLPRENAFYYAHLDSAERVTTALRQVNWQLLDELAAREGDAEAAVIVSALRQAARRDEQEIALAAPLRKASDDTIALFVSRAKQSASAGGPPDVASRQDGKPAGGLGPAPGQGAGPTGTGVPVSGYRPPVSVQPGPDAALPSESVLSPQRIRARDVPAFVERICEAADEHPGAEFEIAWRIVER
jgi:hypothetical protein